MRQGGSSLPNLNHRQRAERRTFLLQVVRDLGRFSRDEEPDRLLRHVHRGIGALLGCDAGFVWRLSRGAFIEACYHWVWTPKGEQILARTDEPDIREQAVRFVAERTTAGSDPHILYTAIEVAGRPAAVFAFIRPGHRFARRDAHFAADGAGILGRHLEERERERGYAVRERIVRKVLLQLRPADILYQVLHGLKRLLRYDHSASVETFDSTALTLTVRAETIAWTKGKSPRIGRPMHLDTAAISWIERLECCAAVDPGLIETAAASTSSLPPCGPTPPAAIITDLATVSTDAPTPRSMIIAPLRRDRAVVGLLTVRAIAPGAFVAADIETIDSFLSILSASAFHAEVFRQQQDRLLEAERRTALGNIARAISHDLSNAFGVIQPLLQKLQEDVGAGTITPDNLKRDLDMLNQYVGISLRIFQGLLSFSRGTSDGILSVDIAASLDAVLSLLVRGLRAQGIEVVREITPGLPQIQARRQDIEQILLNLITNAKESMPAGGSLTISAWVESDGGGRTSSPAGGEAIHITIADTGAGIPARLLERIFEPFFTTKSGGTGLGLDICRSIVWEYDGAIWLESAEKVGSTAHVRFPIRASATPAASAPRSEPGKKENPAE